MTMWLLPNTAGDQATSIQVPTSAAEGFTGNDIISGARNYFYRSTASGSAMVPGYILPANMIATHFVIARADWMVTQSGARIRPVERDSGGSTAYISGVDYNPLASGNLIGIRSQDLCFAVTPTVYRGYLFEFDSAGTEALQFSKFYASAGFNFGVNPSIVTPPEMQDIPKGQTLNQFIPPKGFHPYEVEARIALRWPPVARSVVNSLYALPQLYKWPLFLFDDDASIWPWKLEHVLVESIEETVLSQDSIQITIVFQRLAHYE